MLQVGDLVEWLRRPIVESNGSGPTVGGILVAAGLLRPADDGYALGDLVALEHLTLQTLLEHALQALAGLRLIEIHGDPDQGLFIEVARDEAARTTRYGLRLALNDVVISGPSAPSQDGAALTLQVGKGFEAAVPATTGQPDGGSDTGSEAGDWTNSGSEPGIALTLLEAHDDGTFGFAVGFELVSVGFDYADDGPAGIVNSNGFQLAGVQPRIYLAIGDGVRVGAAVRLEDLELPIDSTFGDEYRGLEPRRRHPDLFEIHGGRTCRGVNGAAGARSSPHRSPSTPRRRSTRRCTTRTASRPPIRSGSTWSDRSGRWRCTSSVSPGLTRRGRSRSCSTGASRSPVSTSSWTSLGVSIPLHDPSATSLGLKGLDVSYSAGSISISGGFAEFDSPDGPSRTARR